MGQLGQERPLRAHQLVGQLSTAEAASAPLGRERNLILGVLLTLSAASWIIVVWQWSVAGSDMGLTMGMAAPLFLALWVAMMVAMMFPTAAPMILMFARIQKGKDARGQLSVPVWTFVGAYLAVWAAFGVLAYFGALGAERLADRSSWLMEAAPRIGGGVLIAAGLYQLSPLKNVCLWKCRTPMQFVLTSWRDGYAGAWRMGTEHGLYCLGCCWMLFVILFPLGIMNVAAMALITVLIFAEKSSPVSRAALMIAAASLIAYGVVVLLFPDALPTAMGAAGTNMSGTGMGGQ
jgi:predicted metal-binding membrane protein